MSTLQKLSELEAHKVAILNGYDEEAKKAALDKGKLTARDRVTHLLDENSFVEIGTFVTSKTFTCKGQKVNTPADGVVCGYGTIEGNLVYVYSQDPTVLGGAIGEMHAKKIAKTYDDAIKMGAPVIGFIIGFMVMCAFLRLFYKIKPDVINRRFKKIQLITSGLMALSHGLNDAQKTMGVITMALVTGGVIVMETGEFNIPIYVKLICAFTMAMGTMSGGWKIIKTMGSKIIKLKPISGAAADFAASLIVLVASHFGIPLSTTHVVSTSIMGVGSAIKGGNIRTNIIGNIVTAWILTIPCCVILSIVLYSTLKLIPH